MDDRRLFSIRSWRDVLLWAGFGAGSWFFVVGLAASEFSWPFAIVSTVVAFVVALFAATVVYKLGGEPTAEGDDEVEEETTAS